jgi:transketolase
VGRSGVVLSMSSFGESAPAKDLYSHFGITAQRVVEAARMLVQRHRANSTGAARAETSVHETA